MQLLATFTENNQSSSVPPHGSSSRQALLKISSLADSPTAWLLLILPRSGSPRLGRLALHMLTAPLTQWTKSRARCLSLAEKIDLGGVGHQHRFIREENDFKLQTLMWSYFCRNMLNENKIILWRWPKEPSNAQSSFYRGPWPALDWCHYQNLKTSQTLKVMHFHCFLFDFLSNVFCPTFVFVFSLSFVYSCNFHKLMTIKTWNKTKSVIE